MSRQSSNASFLSLNSSLASPDPSVASRSDDSLGANGDGALGGGAFGSVLTASGALESSIESTVSATGAADAERPEDQKCPMVCHHWKTKGWCRMEAECKFLHPDHKRGVGSKPRRGRRGRGGDSNAISSSPSTSSPSCTSSPPQVECMP